MVVTSRMPVPSLLDSKPKKGLADGTRRATGPPSRVGGVPRSRLQPYLQRPGQEGGIW